MDVPVTLTVSNCLDGGVTVGVTVVGTKFANIPPALIAGVAAPVMLTTSVAVEVGSVDETPLVAALIALSTITSL